MSEVVRLERSGRIGLVIIDNPPVNAISRPVRQGLLECFRKAAADRSIEAVVLLCDGRTFIAGADIAEFDAPMAQPTCHPLFAEMEALDKPTVAALHGTALGGGFETALACHYRVANPGARVGFPEINLGIVPGAGGTQRLPRVAGVQNALQMFLSGRPVDAEQALAMGLIDAIADGDLRAFAVAYANRLVDEGRGPRRACDVAIERTPEIDAFLQEQRRRASRMRGRVVPGMDIDAVEAAIDLPFGKGIEREQEISDASLETTESRAMRRLFFAEKATGRIPGVDPASARPLASGGIIGGGTMGRGIAMSFANAGIPVTLLDVDRAAVGKSIDAIRGEYQRSVKKGRITEDGLEACMRLIKGSDDYADLAEADVVIEAVFENMALKKKIFAKLDKTCKPGAILASNTSTLDVAEIASATKRPADVVGLHFFSPAHIMRLLEIVRTDATAGDVLAASMQLAKTLRKVGVLSGNAYGFIGNRMMDPYGREAERMLLEGATPRQVDDALESFGMAMGILAVYDMAGVDVGYKVREERKDLLPDDPSFYRSSSMLVERGWLGQKTGVGFYRYEAGSRERHDNPEALEMFAAEAKRLGIKRRDLTQDEIEQRCLCALINEGAKVLEEGVALRASDVDVVYTSGYGFPRHRGGPMFYADTVGLKEICARIDGFAKTLDPQYWQVSALLRELAASGKPLADCANE
ncbi:MAG: 3-hydroxyacyl-CoA dehydrogenase NAD-binding domain-containing protein [Gammaproteobacteria bacterium]|nr:3-hydroxyacyl-CoA dehydrogenase NAD-binding domain-containing protein [Gammaproteobacteria bacterium]MDH4253321.1 3-hydroxyacyl-CoA dehydrogenase NAD-binding domain-containing protein [Gammaproteobacteria bacterium]MDH5309930.1 3-hydroxyacyl-CoA dehydrogenase NAD-binding domain-containing protein [Gammaproteobacteria bacterium]